MTAAPHWRSYDPSPWLALLAVALAVIMPRIFGLGYFVEMDEGYHAFMAQYAWQSITSGQGFPAEMSGFKLYPLLFSWVWALPGNAVVWFRLVDAIVGGMAGWAFCILLCRESRNRLFGLTLAFAFLLGLNASYAIECGFKNSFSPAFFFLFCALNLTYGASGKSSRWFWAGFLTAIAILFRETFAPFVILACVSIAITRNWAAFWRFILGGIAGAFLVTLISALARGQLWGLLEWYFVYGKIYGPEAGRRLHKFLSNGLRSLGLFWPLVAVFACVLFNLLRQPGRQFTGRAWFWLTAAALPLIEPFSKIGFIYHFSVSLPGLAGFCAFAFAHLPPNSRLIRRLQGAAMFACLLMLPMWLPHFEKLPVTLETFKNYPEPGWPESLTDKSTTLQAAAMAAKLAGPGGAVSSSGFAYFVFPAGGFLPPKLHLGDLSRTWIYARGDKEKFLAELKKNPPDVVLLTDAIEDHAATFYPELKDVFANHPDYEYAGQIAPDLDKNYGWLGYHIYKRKKAG